MEQRIISKEDLEMHFGGEKIVGKVDYNDYEREKAETSLTVFENENFGKVRTVTIDNEPWFVAKDVCAVLEIKNTTQACQKLDNDERSMFNIGRQGKVNMVNEYGLNNLILASRKKEAKAFKRWITHEVIPAIRKTGGYIAGEENLNEDELIFKAMNVLNAKVERLKQQNKQLEDKVEEDRPKVLFADSVSASNNTITVGTLAKILKQNGIDTGELRLFNWLRQNGYLIKEKGRDYNRPTQRSMNLDIMKVKQNCITQPNGNIIVTNTPLITGKGENYFVNKFLKDNL